MQATSVPRMAGDPLPDDFVEVFEAHYDLVYRTAHGVTGRVEDAEDVVQTVFLRLLQRNAPRDFIKNPRGYLYRAAVNLSLTVVQARRRRALTEESEELAASIPARASSRAEELHKKLYEAIAQLKPKAAHVLILRYLHNYSDADIARLLGTSRGVIAVTLYRSRARLRKILNASLRTLLSGEQVATSERMATPIANDVAWSRNALDHLTVFHQFAVPAPALPPQDAPREAFEVVSIRRSVVPSGESGRGGGGGGVNRRNRRGDNPCSLGGEPVVDPRRFDAVNVTVVQLVSWAYGLDCWMNRGPDVLFGGPPDWIGQDGFDVEGTIPEGAPSYTRQQLRSHDAPVLQRMLQSLLADRFRLATRRETREMPVYVLSVAQGGPRYTRVNSRGQLVDRNGNPLDKPLVVNGAPMPGGRIPPADRVNPEFSIWQEGDSRDVLQLTPWEIHGRQKTIGDLVSTLSLFTGRPVLDRTGLTSRFNFFFEFAVMECPTCPFTAPAPEAPREPGAGPRPDRPLVSVLEQVGLELRPSREQVEVLVIERVERPTEN